MSLLGSQSPETSTTTGLYSGNTSIKAVYETLNAMNVMSKGLCCNTLLKQQLVVINSLVQMKDLHVRILSYRNVKIARKSVPMCIKYGHYHYKNM